MKQWWMWVTRMESYQSLVTTFLFSAIIVIPIAHGQTMT
jgi:hypothetical protein